ncbi:MAG TPA: mannitol dehydrogenase family protein [Pseudobacteroides sp.]|uniref:mannitol dehydrogenase family protein n=1 Tax=Pseudobacteroides sp. TaxID=1968840 RepID=UPI002F932621
MKLSRNTVKEYSIWKDANIGVPNYDIEEMVSKTKKNPTWIHFGAGNIFKGFIAPLQDTLLGLKKSETGVIVAETYDIEIIDKIYAPYDNLSLLVLMNPDGSLKSSVVGSIAESLIGDSSMQSHWERLKRIFEEPSLQMVSFTITEKGYALTGASGDYLNDVKHDFESGPEQPKHIMSKIASLAYCRYLKGESPVAFVSMDNCSKNGEVLQNSINTIVRNWIKTGFVDNKFLDYLNNPKKVSFPWSMIDKITPRPSDKIKERLGEIGFESTEVICTDKNTFISPFVNAEISQYLVIEDHFPNGRMPLEAAGVLFTDRQTVNMVEKMKVGACLNPLHTALAVFGCLLGYRSIADEMKDRYLRKLVEKIGYDEGLPVVEHPGILDPQAFIKEVIEARFPNKYIPDTPQRIATDTSQKIPVRFGETIKTYFANDKLDINSLKYIPLAIAGWCRYLLGVDDNGDFMELSPDPMLAELKSYVSEIKFGNEASVDDRLKPILSNDKLFGIDLYSTELGTKVEGYFKEMICGKHAVKTVLEKYI